VSKKWGKMWQRGVEGRERRYVDRVLGDDDDRQCHKLSEQCG